MGFLGIGAMEALVILVIALIIFGPGRLPEMMGEAGRMVRDFRRATRELTGDFEESISEVRGTYREIEDEMRQTATDFRRDAKGMADDVNAAVTDITKLDDKPTPARRNRPAPRNLDQMTEAESLADAPKPQREPTRKTGGTDSTREKAAVSQPSNGSVGSDDDLLAIEEGDDLLSTGGSD